MVSIREVVLIDSENFAVLSQENAVFFLDWLLPLTKAEVCTSQVKGSIELVQKINPQIQFQLKVDANLNPQIVSSGSKYEILRDPLPLTRKVHAYKPLLSANTTDESAQDYENRLYSSLFGELDNKRIVILPTPNIQAVARWNGLQKTPAMMTIVMDSHKASMSRVLYSQEQVFTFRAFIESTTQKYPLITLDLAKPRAEMMVNESMKVVDELKGKMADVKPVEGVEVVDYTPALQRFSLQLEAMRGRFGDALNQLEGKVDQVKAVKREKGENLQKALLDIRAIKEQQNRLVDVLRLISEQTIPSLAALTTRLDSCAQLQSDLQSNLQQAFTVVPKPLLLTVTWAGRNGSQFSVMVAKKKPYSVKGSVKVSGGQVAVTQQFELKDKEMDQTIAVGSPGNFSAAGEFLVQVVDETDCPLSADYTINLTDAANEASAGAEDQPRSLPLRTYERTLIYIHTGNMVDVEAHIMDNFGQERLSLLRYLARCWVNESLDQATTVIDAVMDPQLATQEAVVERLKAAGLEFNFA